MQIFRTITREYKDYRNINEFEVEITRLIKEGYYPTGGICFNYNLQNEKYIVSQGMIENSKETLEKYTIRLAVLSTAVEIAVFDKEMFDLIESTDWSKAGGLAILDNGKNIIVVQTLIK